MSVIKRCQSCKKVSANALLIIHFDGLILSGNFALKSPVNGKIKTVLQTSILIILTN